MVYQGSKTRIAKFIVPILQKEIEEKNLKTYVEPFVGGANVIDKIKCEKRLGYDASPSLIALLIAARDDFSLIPKEINREIWDLAKAGKSNFSLAEIGAIQYLGSYNAAGFHKGYANPSGGRNYYDERYRNLKKQSPNLKGIEFEVRDYLKGDYENCLIYCDPPYQNTSNYGKHLMIDPNEFWDWILSLRGKGNSIFVSEEVFPIDKNLYEVVWEKEVKRTITTKTKLAIEKLIKIKE